MALEKIAPIETLAFDVTAGDYEEFIGTLRGALAGNNPPPPTVVDPTTGVSRPVLAKETTTDTQPPRWIHVQLNGYKGVAPKVAIRSDNVYVMGFTNSQNKWFQLNDTKYKHKLVDDKAVMVGFDGNYTTLLGAKGVDALPDLNLCNVRVEIAASKLWNWIPNKAAAADADDGGQETGAVGADPQTDLRRAVATVIVAISEAARFAAVSDVINQGWYGYQAGVTAKEVGYIRDWGDLSEALLKWKNAGYPNDTDIFDKFQKIGINNGEQAVAVVALVKLIIRSTSSTAAAGDLLAYAELPKLGRYMAEVFAVRVPYAAAAAGEGRPPHPRGTISFHGGHYCSGFLYSHEERQDSSCDSQGNIVLTGPSVAISAYSPIVFSLDLHDGSSSKSQAGRIVCDVAGGDFYSYDRAITETIETGYGPAEVTYAVLTNGVQGLVAVKLASLQVGDEEGAGILGWIVARSKLFDDVGSVLFYNDDARKIVRGPPGGELLLPLARQALAVPLHMPLTIELDLRSSSSGDEIARGAIDFNPAIEGQHSQRLVGINGAELEVTISWSEYPW